MEQHEFIPMLLEWSSSRSQGIVIIIFLLWLSGMAFGVTMTIYLKEGRGFLAFVFSATATLLAVMLVFFVARGG